MPFLWNSERTHIYVKLHFRDPCIWAGRFFKFLIGFVLRLDLILAFNIIMLYFNNHKRHWKEMIFLMCSFSIKWKLCMIDLIYLWVSFRSIWSIPFSYYYCTAIWSCFHAYFVLRLDQNIVKKALAQLFYPAFQWQHHRMRSSLARLRTAANHSFSGWKMYAAASLPISFSEWIWGSLQPFTGKIPNFCASHMR